LEHAGKKTVVAVHQEIAREVSGWLSRVFIERQNTGRMDLEAVEMGLRTTLHQAGAAALGQLLEYPEPAADQLQLPCSCGHTARYRELRPKTLTTVLGEATLWRPY
jgi:hypothetical protein